MLLQLEEGATWEAPPGTNFPPGAISLVALCHQQEGTVKFRKVADSERFIYSSGLLLKMCHSSVDCGLTVGTVEPVTVLLYYAAVEESLLMLAVWTKGMAT